MNTNTSNPISSLARSEATLVQSLDAVTARVNSIATGNITDAMARLEAATVAARQRLADAVTRAQVIAADLIEDIEDMAAGLLADVASNDLPQLPAQSVEALPAPAVQDQHVEPKAATGQFGQSEPQPEPVAAVTQPASTVADADDDTEEELIDLDAVYTETTVPVDTSSSPGSDGATMPTMTAIPAATATTSATRNGKASARTSGKRRR